MAILRIKNADGSITSIPAIKGDKGDNGDTPQREVDYWTEEDKSEIKAYVEEVILGGLW